MITRNYQSANDVVAQLDIVHKNHRTCISDQRSAVASNLVLGALLSVLAALLEVLLVILCHTHHLSSAYGPHNDLNSLYFIHGICLSIRRSLTCSTNPLHSLQHVTSGCRGPRRILRERSSTRNGTDAVMPPRLEIGQSEWTLAYLKKQRIESPMRQCRRDWIGN